jgi:calcineurin-like phosphoesterase family protein
MYLDDLTKIVTYGGNPRPRVRFPTKWEQQPTKIECLTHDPIDITHTSKNVFVWSDPHFSHNNIIRFCDRPFGSARHMNEQLIENHNNTVGPDDICIWGGDVGFGSTDSINDIVKMCNGYKILVIGNHDFRKKKIRSLKFDETYLLYTIDLPKGALVFTHYPMDNIHHPYFNVHGHTHNKLTGNSLHYNVSCELHDYKPIPLETIVNYANTKLEK